MRDSVTEEVLRVIEQNLRALADDKSTYDVTVEEKTQCGELADKVAQIRFPIKIEEN